MSDYQPPPNPPPVRRNTGLIWTSVAVILIGIIVALSMRDETPPPEPIETRPTPSTSVTPPVPTPDPTPTPSVPESPPAPDTAPVPPTTPDAPLTPRTEGGGEPLKN